MADGKTHNRIGKAAGTVAALARTREDEELWKKVAAAVGGYLAGGAGAAAPDWLEPAIHSYHRDVGHSFVGGVAAIKLTRLVIASWEKYCRTRADAAAAQRVDPVLEDLDRLLLVAQEVFWRVAVGFASGVAAGYISHLALDASTPRGIPFLTRGF